MKSLRKKKHTKRKKKKEKKIDIRRKEKTTPLKTNFRSEALYRSLCQNEAYNPGVTRSRINFLIIPSVITLNSSVSRR